MKKISILLCVLGFTVLFAEKLEITADKFVAKDADRAVRFLGNAQIIQGQTKINAARIIVYFNEDNSTQKYSAEGGVHFHIRRSKTDYQGSCSSMSYFPPKKVYILKGNIRVRDRKNRRDMTAEKAEIHSKTGAFSISGGKKAAAKLTFDMK